MSRYDHITLLAIPSVSILTVLLFSLSFTQIPDIVLYTPFILSALFLGLPHGAVDHIIPNKINSKYKSSQIVILYLILMTLYLILWYLEPVLSAIIFIIITWIHWGQGDLYVYDSVLNSNHIVGNLQKVLHIIIRGALPMFVPLYFYRPRYVEIIKSMSEMVAENVNIIISQSVVLSTTFLLICLAAIYILISLYRLFESNWTGKYTFFADITEISILLLYFAIVPPVLAIGVYFCLWHSLRHIVRIIDIETDMSSSFELRRFITDMRWFARKSIPTTVISLLLLTGLFFYMSSGNYGIVSMLSVYLIVIAILTPPHFLVVVLMDKKDNIW